MTLIEFVAVLVSTNLKVYHQVGPDKPGKRLVVWNEYNSHRQPGGPLLIRNIQVDLFTKDEQDPAEDKLLSALDKAGIFHDEPSVSYDKETGYTRYLIECQIVDTVKRRK